LAISTLAELKTAIETFRERSGDATITGNAADFVTLAEARLNRKLPPLREMWSNTPLTGTVDSRELSLPSDYVEPEFLKITSSDRFDELKPETAKAMRYYDTSGEPTAWCINGSKINLDRPCDSAYTFSFRYRAKLQLGSAGAQLTTNWLLTHHPDLYLAAVLVWSGLLIKDEDVAVWRALLDEGMDEVAYTESRSTSVATLGVDPALRSSFAVYTSSSTD
jgi:hypothetical protein